MSQSVSNKNTRSSQSDREKMDPGYIQYNLGAQRYEPVSWKDLFEQNWRKKTQEETDRWNEAEQKIQSRLRERDVISGYHIEDPWGWLFNAK